MVPLHTKKGVKRYRYYLSRPKLTGRGTAGSLHRISAGMLEGFVADHLAPRLAAGWLPDQPPLERCVAALKRLVLGVDRLDAHVLTAALPPGADAEEGEDASLIRLAFDMRRERGAVILQAPGSALPSKPHMDRALVRAVVLARKWSRELELGEVASIKALARREQLCNHYTSRLLPLAYLAPDLTEMVLTGRQPRGLTPAAITADPLPLDWDTQRALFHRG